VAVPAFSPPLAIGKEADQLEKYGSAEFMRHGIRLREAFLAFGVPFFPSLGGSLIFFFFPPVVGETNSVNRKQCARFIWGNTVLCLVVAARVCVWVVCARQS